MESQLATRLDLARQGVPCELLQAKCDESSLIDPKRAAKSATLPSKQALDAYKSFKLLDNRE